MWISWLAQISAPWGWVSSSTRAQSPEEQTLCSHPSFSRGCNWDSGASCHHDKATGPAWAHRPQQDPTTWAWESRNRKER